MSRRIKSLPWPTKFVLFILSIIAPYLFWDIIYDGTLLEYTYTNPWDSIIFLTLSWFVFWLLVRLVLWLSDSAKPRA